MELPEINVINPRTRRKGLSDPVSWKNLHYSLSVLLKSLLIFKFHRLTVMLQTAIVWIF